MDLPDALRTGALRAGDGNRAAVAPSPPRHFPELDGLRGLCALAVLLTHAVPQYFPFGPLAVEIFFVISAFCLSYPHFLRAGRTDWKKYAWYRIRRIAPAYYASALLAMSVYWLAHPGGLRRLSVLSCLLFSGDTFNRAYWSLEVEARWYLVLPLMLLALEKWGFRSLWIGSSVLCLATLPFFSSVGPGLHVISVLPIYLPLFLAGILWARREAEIEGARGGPPGVWIATMAVGGIAAMTALEFGYTRFYGRPAFAEVLGMPAALATSVCALNWKPFRMFLSSPWLVWVGQFSYSLYLTHLTLYGLAGCLEPRGMAPWKLAWIHNVAVPPLAILFAWLFYLGFERPFLRPSRAKNGAANGIRTAFHRTTEKLR